MKRNVILINPKIPFKKSLFFATALDLVYLFQDARNCTQCSPSGSLSAFNVTLQSISNMTFNTEINNLDNENRIQTD